MFYTNHKGSNTHQVYVHMLKEALSFNHTFTYIKDMGQMHSFNSNMH